MLDEGSDKLDAQKFFLRSGSKLLDFLHQRLCDLHLLIRKIMLPRHRRSKDGGFLEFFKPEGFAAGELVLGIEPFRPPAGIVFGHLEVEVGDIRTHLTAEATSLELQRAPDDEDSAPKRPVGFDPQEAFTKRDETRNVQNCVGIQIMELNPVCKEKAVEERVWGEESRKEIKITRNPGGGRGMISRPAASDSTGVFFRRFIFSAWDSSLSPTLVWTQRPMTEASASAVLALLATAPTAAPVAEELLLPMGSACSNRFENGCGQKKQLLQGARRKMVAAE
jgi:hypothetical protein